MHTARETFTLAIVEADMKGFLTSEARSLRPGSGPGPPPAAGPPAGHGWQLEHIHKRDSEAFAFYPANF